MLLGRRRFTGLALPLLAPLALDACSSSPNPNYYSVAVRSGPTFPAGPKIVLVIELSQRLPASTVYGESGAIAADHNVMVGVNIQRLDADKAGKLILIAQVAAEFNRPRRMAARTFTLSRPLATQDTPGLVAAISDTMGELADGVAALLQP